MGFDTEASSEPPAEDNQDQGVQAESSPAEDVTRESSTPEDLGAEGEQSPEEYSTGLQDAIRKAATEADPGEEAEGDPSGKSKTDEQSGKDDEADGDEADGGEADGGEGKEGEKDGKGKQDAESDEGEDVEPGQAVPYDRFKSVIDERNAWREQVEGFRPQAEQFNQIQTFMEDNGLRPEDVARGFEIMALINSDPLRARQELEAIMEPLNQFAGVNLPDDLQREVEDGVISEERAQELALYRNQTHFESQRSQQTQERLRQTQEQTRQQAEQRQLDEAIQAQQNAVSTWESQIAETDPDFERLKPMVMREVKARVMDQPPQTPEQAVSIAKEALRTVKEEVRKLIPPRPEKGPAVNSAHAGNSGAADQQPQSMLDAVMQAANAST